MTKLVFVDTETTGLDPERHEIWEVAIIVRDHENTPEPRDYEFVWNLHIDEAKADLIALNIGQYFTRTKNYTSKLSVASYIQDYTTGAHLVGAVVSFDEERLRKLLLQEHYIPAWHYHLVDVEALTAGALRIPPPWKSSDLWEKLGLNLDNYERHTALGDARMARDIYDKVMAL